MLNLFLTALPLLGNYLFSQKNKKQSQQTIQTNQKRYEQKLSQLDSLFNRNYYSNILDRSDVRGLLGNLREQMSETTRNLKNKATITGATPETVVTVQSVSILTSANPFEKESASSYRNGRNSCPALSIKPHFPFCFTAATSSLKFQA